MGSIPRRMTLPTINGREDPIYKAPLTPASDPAHGSAFILIHGLGDSASGLEDIANQFQSNSKLPHMHWVIPNALFNEAAMTAAWFAPTSFAPSADSSAEEIPKEDEAGMRETVQYIESLIDACVKKGIPPQRIVLGGFSQGCAISLLTDFTSNKYSGRLAGIVGLSGYLPFAYGREIENLRAHADLPPAHGEVPVFLSRGTADEVVPKRIWLQSLKKMEQLGLNAEAIEMHEYEGLGNEVSGDVLRDLSKFLTRIVPKLED